MRSRKPRQLELRHLRRNIFKKYSYIWSDFMRYDTLWNWPTKKNEKFPRKTWRSQSTWFLSSFRSNEKKLGPIKNDACVYWILKKYITKNLYINNLIWMETEWKVTCNINDLITLFIAVVNVSNSLIHLTVYFLLLDRKILIPISRCIRITTQVYFKRRVPRLRS